MTERFEGSSSSPEYDDFDYSGESVELTKEHQENEQKIAALHQELEKIKSASVEAKGSTLTERKITLTEGMITVLERRQNLIELIQIVNQKIIALLGEKNYSSDSEEAELPMLQGLSNHHQNLITLLDEGTAELETLHTLEKEKINIEDREFQAEIEALERQRAQDTQSFERLCEELKESIGDEDSDWAEIDIIREESDRTMAELEEQFRKEKEGEEQN